jgi:hypothetical protein
MVFLYPAITLMIDAMQVMDMRLRLIASGKGTPDEMLLMTSEKIDALAQAGTILIQGGKIVAATVKRLRLPE